MTANHRAKKPTETVTLDVPANGRDEMNLAEFPISLLADRAPKGTKTLIFRDGEGTLTVTGSDAYGLPTALDADVIVALIQLTKLRNNFLQPTVNFTRYELLRLLGWPNEGKSYRRLDESLNRWVGVTLHYDGTWWDNRSKRYGDAKIHIIESVVILDGKSRIHGEEQQALPLSSFTWNKMFMESFRADNLKRLDVEVYFSLIHPSSKRLYRFLDKRFYRRSDWIFDLKEIAFERVGLSRNYAKDMGKVKEKLQPAIDELENRDFLQPMARDERYFKEGKNWKIRLVAKQSSALPAPANEAKPELPVLAIELMNRGVSQLPAVELVQRHPAELIERQLEFFDWQMQKKPEKIGEPGGYLVDAIKKGYAAPKGFVSKAERTKQHEERQGKERQAAEDKRRQREQEAHEKAERKAIDAYWASLTPEQQAEIDAASTAQADAATLALETGPLKSMGQTLRRHAYIRQLLHDRQAAES